MATTTLMSLAEFECLDAGADKIELLNGELIRVPPAKRRHNQDSEELYWLLRSALERAQACSAMRAHHEMGYCVSRNPDSWFQPDVSVTHPNQFVERSEGDDDYYIGAPLIAFEMVSPSDSATTLQEKIAEYLAHGAAEVWVMFRKKRDAWVYSSGASVARHETRSFRSDSLPGVEIPFDKIFV